MALRVPGRLIFGFLGDYFNKRYLLAIAYLLQAVGIYILLTADSIQQVFLFTVVFGMGWGAPNLLFALRADYFGRKYFATIAGVEQSIVAILSRDWLRTHPHTGFTGTGRPGIEVLAGWWEKEGQMVLRGKPYSLPPGLELFPADFFERSVPLPPEMLKKLEELGYIETQDDG